jgi:hypothetical protein
MFRSYCCSMLDVGVPGAVVVVLPHPDTCRHPSWGVESPQRRPPWSVDGANWGALLKTTTALLVGRHHS